MKQILLIFIICIMLIFGFWLRNENNSQSEITAVNTQTNSIMDENTQSSANVSITEQMDTTENSEEQYAFYNSEEWILEDLNSLPEYTSDMKELQPQNDEPMIISSDEYYDNYVQKNQWYYDKYLLYQPVIRENGVSEFLPEIPYRGFYLESDEYYVLPPIISNGSTSDFEYLVHKNGKIQLIKYTGKNTDVTIPDEIEGKAVAYLGEMLFIDSNIKSVRLGKNIETVGSHAFYMCRQLNDVILSDKTEYIFSCAFCLTDSLRQISLPDSLKLIGADAFSESGIEKITVPASTKIGVAAFADNRQLRKLTLENGINNIESQAFVGIGVDYLYIPSSLTKIGGIVFANCDNLKKVEFAETMDEETVVCASMFEGCNNLSDVKLPTNITAIYEDAFRGCLSLRQISIPSSVKEIHRGAFGECYNLSDIYFGSPDCDGLEDSGIVGQKRTIHAPAGGNIEEFCKRHVLLEFVPKD